MVVSIEPLWVVGGFERTYDEAGLLTAAFGPELEISVSFERFDVGFAWILSSSVFLLPGFCLTSCSSPTAESGDVTMASLWDRSDLVASSLSQASLQPLNGLGFSGSLLQRFVTPAYV